jgi:thioredoxin 1
MREITITELKESQKQGKKLLVDLKASWCMPCKQLIPRLENIQKKYSHIDFVTVDVDENPDFAIEQNVRAVPTVIIFDGEKIINRSSGVNPDSFYTNILDTL